MYMIPAEHGNAIRPQAAIGSERAARLGPTQNHKTSQNSVAQDKLIFNLPLGDRWVNSSGGGEIPAPPRVLAAIGSERAARLAALKNPNLRQNSSKKKNTEGPESKEAIMYKIPGANENKRRQQAAIGSERAARLAAMENLGSGHNSAAQDNQNINLSLGDCWPNLCGEGDTSAPSHVLAAIGSESLDLKQNSAVRQLELSPQSLPLHDDDDDDLSFCTTPAAHGSCISVLPGWQKDPLKEVHSRPGHTFSIFPQEEAAAQGLANQQQLESILQPERAPHSDSEPLTTPAPTSILSIKPKELNLLFDKTPVQANSSMMSTLSGCQGKGKEELKVQLELPFSTYDDHVLEDLLCVQARNDMLTESILNIIPNEQRRQQFQLEIMQRREQFELEQMRRKLRSEKQLTRFLEGKLAQDASEP